MHIAARAFAGAINESGVVPIPLDRVVDQRLLDLVIQLITLTNALPERTGIAGVKPIEQGVWGGIGGI